MQRAESYYPSSQVNTMRRSSWCWGALIGFWLGIIFMAVTDVGDLHFCIGQCDSAGITVWRGEFQQKMIGAWPWPM